VRAAERGLDRLAGRLSELGLAVTEATGLAAGARAVRRHAFDAVVLDLDAERVGDACRALREAGPVAIVALGRRQREGECLAALDAGADDYVPPPVSPEEVAGRVRSLLRRRTLDRADAAGVLEAGGLHIDLIRQRVLCRDVPVRLTPSEFRLLAYLAVHAGSTCSRAEIMRRLWDSEYVGDDRACDVHVCNLRRKLERDPARPELIVTVAGRGYRLRVS
jgi:two-component system KDP operon response regulator KdpE